jgi:hypothetical protein
VSAAGYVTRDVRVSAEFGDVVPYDVLLDRDATEFAELMLRAELPGGAPFTGALMLRVGGPFTLMWFKEGRALKSLHVPVGRALLQVNGALPAGEWWAPAAEDQPITVMPPGNRGSQEHMIHLAGQRVSLDVQLVDGSPAHHYDFQVAGSKSGAGWDRGWEARFRRFASRFGFSPDDAQRVKPFVYLAPGAYELLVNVPGRGYARQAVRVRKSAGPQEVSLRITPDDRYEARTER